ERFPKELAKTTRQGEAVYWPNDLSPADYRHYRIPTAEETSKRKAEEIPVEEIENAILCILERYLSYPREDLPRGAGRILGFGRITDTVASFLNAALAPLVRDGRLLEENGAVTLPNAPPPEENSP